MPSTAGPMLPPLLKNPPLPVPPLTGVQPPPPVWLLLPLLLGVWEAEDLGVEEVRLPSRGVRLSRGVFSDEPPLLSLLELEGDGATMTLALLMPTSGSSMAEAASSVLKSVSAQSQHPTSQWHCALGQ